MKLNRLIILVAEDDENDRFLLQRAIARTGVQHEIHMVCNGEEAIQYLKATGEYADRTKYPFPNVLILDLKMPVRSGFDLLQWLHDHEQCADIPAIVFTSSALPEDIRRSYILAANSYFTKPSNLDDLIRVLKLIFDYWYEAHVPDPPPQHLCQ